MVSCLIIHILSRENRFKFKVIYKSKKYSEKNIYIKELSFFLINKPITIEQLHTISKLDNLDLKE